MKNDKITYIFTIFFLIGGIGAFAYAFYLQSLSATAPPVAKRECVTTNVVVKNKDTAMRPIFAPLKMISVTKGYYDCNPILRNDFAFFQPSASVDPVPRFVVGLPGDKVVVSKLKPPQQWGLKINELEIKVKDKPYYFKSNLELPPLKSYLDSRQGVIGENEYLVISLESPGYLDSSSIGLVKKGAFIGKVSTQPPDPEASP